MKKRISELEREFKQLSQYQFASLNALVEVLIERGITSHKEYRKYLAAYKRYHAGVTLDQEFEKLIKSFHPQD
ncbi:MAG: hypothetical protein JW893_01075 [Candidatus Omnitrophica bacterium]|nr:hypothetical protein [Candidatus Omnitrophota bacterium]